MFFLRERNQKKTEKPKGKYACYTTPSIPRMEFFNSGGLKSVVLLKKMPLVDHYLGVSKNRGIPKWMVYNGKPY